MRVEKVLEHQACRDHWEGLLAYRDHREGLRVCPVPWDLLNFVDNHLHQERNALAVGYRAPACFAVCSDPPVHALRRVAWALPA